MASAGRKAAARRAGSGGKGSGKAGMGKSAGPAPTQPISPELKAQLDATRELNPARGRRKT